MNHQNEPAQLRFLEETANQLRQNGFTWNQSKITTCPSALKKAPLPYLRQGSVL